MENQPDEKSIFLDKVIGQVMEKGGEKMLDNMCEPVWSGDDLFVLFRSYSEQESEELILSVKDVFPTEQVTAVKKKGDEFLSYLVKLTQDKSTVDSKDDLQNQEKPLDMGSTLN